MTPLLRSLLLIFSLSLLPAFAAGGAGEGLTPFLQTDAALRPSSDRSFNATITFKLLPGWHTYWSYPGDSGLPPSVEWHLPAGWKASPLEFSIPSLFKEPGDMIIYGYEGSASIRATIIPPSDLTKEEIFKTELKASVSWLACSELCVPGSSELSTIIGSVASGGLANLSHLWPESGDPPFVVKQTFKNGSYYLSFNGIHNATYQFYPAPIHSASGSTSNDVPIPPSIVIAAGNTISILQPWRGNDVFRGLLVETLGGAQGSIKKAWWIRNNTTQAMDHKVNGVSIIILISALLSGFIGGLILNLMPCVLPVISLKIFNFIAQAGESPRRIFMHGVSFAVGIFTWFMGLGCLVIALKAGGSDVTWGAFQFQNPLFVVGLSVLVFLFALNLFGVFDFVLPGKAINSLDHVARKDGYGGSFFQGLFATLLATPCTAPFLGSALGFAFGQSSLVILAMFASVSLGMAFPYLLLSARPGWRKWIPKPGTWMERLKQFMGFPLLATNLWLLWVLQNQRGEVSALALLTLFLILGFCAWFFGTLSASGSRGAAVFRVMILLVAITAIIMTIRQIRFAEPIAETQTSSDQGVPWVSYSAEALDSLRTEGKPVLVDFTASWCLTCQFNERTAINVPAVRKLMKEREITAMKGDWTNADPAITAALKSFGRVGVPLAVFYPAGKGSLPIVLPELLTEKIVLETLKK